MVAKYFVWGSGAWRELDVSTGAVRGWRRRARFVFVRRGRLQLARRRPVLRALAALARDQPSAAADGPRLAHLREQSSRRLQPIAAPAPAPAPAPAAPVHHCCAHYNGCMSSHSSVSVQREAGVQCGAAGAGQGAGPGAGGGVTLSLQRPAHSSGEEFATPRPRPGPRRSKSRSAQLQADTTDLFRPPPVKDASEPKKKTEKKRVERVAESASPPRAKRARVSSSSEAAEECKELVVTERDLAALRGFVARSRRAALERFDADEHYRRALCYAINPLVTLRRCHQLERLQRQQARTSAHNDADADKENKAVPPPLADSESRRKPRPLATHRDKLRRSLRARPDAGSERAQDTPDKAADTKQAAPRAGSSTKQHSPMKAPPIPSSPIKAPLKSSSPKKAPSKPGSPKKAPPRKAVSPPRVPATKPGSPVKGAAKAGAHAAISNRPSASRSKEYSSLEDHCIVSWLTCGARASQVNGNRLWQELQPEYPRLTGQERSWHSLRNRYLRYILPSLGALGLPPPDVSRLRAAAATGCIKHGSRSGPASRRASIFRQDAVRSASGRRPRVPPATPAPAPPAVPDAAARPTDKQEDSKTESSTSSARVTRRSRGPAERATTPQPSTSKDNRVRPSPPRTRPRVSRVSARSASQSESSSSSSSDEDTSLATKDNTPPRRGRGRPPGRRDSEREPTPSSSSSEHDHSSDTDSAAAAERRRSLRYSEVTRRFAARHRPGSGSGSGSGSPGPAGPRPARTPRPARPAPDRSRSSDDFEPDRPARARKLFNPNAKL